MIIQGTGEEDHVLQKHIGGREISCQVGHSWHSKIKQKYPSYPSSPPTFFVWKKFILQCQPCMHSAKLV